MKLTVPLLAIRLLHVRPVSNPQTQQCLLRLDHRYGLPMALSLLAVEVFDPLRVPAVEPGELGDSIVELPKPYSIFF